MVSVAIPAYNRAGTIGACLDSLRAQTYPHWEAIVVDDGSKDATAEIVQAMAAREPRLRLVRHGANRGAQAARNSAIRASSGAWIAFFDSDDVLLPRSIELRLREAAARNAQVVHSNCDVQEAGGRRRLGVPPLAGRVYRELLGRQGPMYPALLVRKAALERIGYLDESIVAYQEWDTTIRLAEHYNFAYVEEPTFVYDRRGADMISKQVTRAAAGYEQIIRKHRRRILLHAGPAALGRHCAILGRLFRRAGDARRARLYWLCAWLLAPFRIHELPRLLRDYGREPA